jgi:elongator complex protein 5
LVACLLIIDTLHPLARLPDINLPAFLSSLIAPTTSIVATYHLDIPLSSPASPYNPSPLNLLKYLATTIFSTHSLSQVLARRRAAERSVAEPVFGLAEEVEGVLIGLGSNDARGIVLEMEHRRKSGREVEEWFFIPAPPPPAAIDRPRERAILLEDHPLFRVSESTEGGTIDGAEAVSTFSLGLTEKQKLDRDGVVLPYFDAQKEGGGVGGRILYDMGVEDDFDEEEDEI